MPELKYLKHTEIDKQKWDACVENAGNGLVYGMSWYLDSVSPNWEALVFEDYIAVFPLPVKKKMGITYLIQPYFAQQFNIYGNSVDSQLINSVFEQITYKYKYAVLSLSESIISSDKSEVQVVNSNYELSLRKPYTDIFDTYSKDNKKNIRRSRNKALEVKLISDVDLLFKFYKNCLQNNLKGVTDFFWKAFYNLVYRISTENRGDLFGVYSEGNLIGVGCFAICQQRIYMLGTASNGTGRKLRAQNFLIDEVIKRYAGSDFVLDFEGSNVPSIAYFFEGFGSVETNYVTWKYNNLPFLLRGVKR